MMPYYAYNVSLFGVHFHEFCKYTLHVCYVLNVIDGIILMTERSQFRFDQMILYCPTDNNPKNLELSSSQSVPPTGLDQLEYSSELLHSCLFSENIFSVDWDLNVLSQSLALFSLRLYTLSYPSIGVPTMLK